MTAESDDSMQQVAADFQRTCPGQDAAALDVWLHRALADRFDSTLDEALPIELTALLSGLH